VGDRGHSHADRRVDLVGDPRDESAERGQFLALDELRLSGVELRE
jgi:hypothetical protein